MILHNLKNINIINSVTKFWIVCILAVFCLGLSGAQAQLLGTINSNDNSSSTGNDTDGNSSSQGRGFRFVPATSEELNRSGGSPVTIPGRDGDSSSASARGDATPTDNNSSLSVINTTTINNNGNVTTTTDSGDIGSGIPTNTNDDASSSIDLEPVPSLNDTTSSDDAADTSKTEEKVDDTVYTGVYEGRRLFTDLMAQHCKINAEDVVKDINKMYDCLNQYITEMNNSNAAAKSKANEDFTLLQISVMRDLVATAITKLQNVNNFEETSQKYKEAADQVKTERDDNSVMVYTQSYMANILNSIRELQSQSLMFEAINGLAYIDPSVIADNSEEKTSSKSNKSGNSATSDSTIIQSNTSVSSGNGGEAGDSSDSNDADYDYLGDGKCLENGKTVTCSEGKHTDKDGNSMYCIDGECTRALEEVEVIGTRKNPETSVASAEQNDIDEMGIRNLESAKKLSPDKFRKALEAYRRIINDSSSPEGAKEAAKYYLEILNQAAPSVFADQPCAKVKRELGLTVSCSDWNNQDKTH